MELRNFTYLFILFVIIAIPLAFTFNKEMKFYTRLKYLVPALLITGTLFIIWDTKFESAGIWSFNREYTLGTRILNLPAEEWLFFLVIPYSLTFINELLRIKIPELVQPLVFYYLNLILLVLFATVAWFNREKLYTFNNFLFLTVYLGYIVFRKQHKHHFYWFYATWLISMVPLLIFLWIITSLPVIEYNSTQLTGIMLFTIPVEDIAYLLLLYLMTDTIYQYLYERRFY